jgi:hypothetical protein
LRHRATLDLWHHDRQLPDEIQALANRCYVLLKQDSRYPSLHFKKVGQFWSVSAVEENGAMARFWIGTHAEYER